MVQDTPVYKNAARPVTERVNDLLARLTLEEKLAQIASVWVYELFEATRFSEQKARARVGHGIGQITRIGGASNSSPRQSAELANQIQRFLVEQTRLGIPALVHDESCSGYMAMGATCYPQMIGLASTWKPELVEQMAPSFAPRCGRLACSRRWRRCWTSFATPAGAAARRPTARIPTWLVAWAWLMCEGCRATTFATA